LYVLPERDALDAAINYSFGEGRPLPAGDLSRVRRLAKRFDEQTLQRYFDLTIATMRRILAGMAPSEKRPSREQVATFRRDQRVALRQVGIRIHATIDSATFLRRA